MGIEYYTFDRVLKELQMGEDELKRLVSEGEIRAFRDEDKMKFKKSDIEGLKKGRMTEPTIILPSGGGGEEDSELDDESSEVLLVEDDTSETLLDIDELDEDEGSSSSTSVPTVDFSVDETGSETLTEELVFDDDSSDGFETENFGGQETMVDDDSGMTTEPIQLVDDDDDDESATMAAPPPMAARRGGGARPAPTAEAPRNQAMSAVLVISSIVLLYGGFLVINLIQEEDNALSGPITDFFARQFPSQNVDEAGVASEPKSEGQKDQYIKWRRQVREGSFAPTPGTPAPSAEESANPPG